MEHDIRRATHHKKKIKSVYDFDEINRQNKTIFAEAVDENEDIEFDIEFEP